MTKKEKLVIKIDTDELQENTAHKAIKAGIENMGTKAIPEAEAEKKLQEWAKTLRKWAKFDKAFNEYADNIEKAADKQSATRELDRAMDYATTVFLPKLVDSIPEEAPFYKMAAGAAVNLAMETMGAGSRLEELPARKKMINHNNAYEVFEDGKKRQVTIKNATTQMTIELSDIDQMIGSNKATKKLFVLALTKANEQAIYNEQLTKDYISFPLQELIEIGFYKNLRSARRGFMDGMNALTSMKIKGTIKQNKKEESRIDALEVLFTGARIEKGQCVIFLNNRIDWGIIAPAFTILPRYYFKLPNRASDLLWYIFNLARQRTKNIEEKGYFTIGFRAIQQKLMLPNEKGLNNPQRDIKQPIEDAIEQIEIEHSNFYNNTEFALLPFYDENAPIADYLDNGYLQISLNGAFAEPFKKFSKNKTMQIEAEKKRRDKITDKARAANLAKKINHDEQ